MESWISPDRAWSESVRHRHTIRGLQAPVSTEAALLTPQAYHRRMEPPPHIDDHLRTVRASPERTWSALLAVVQHSMGRPLPAMLVSAWGLNPPRRSGDWDRPALGASIPGFAVAEVDAPRLLVLRGRHRFSRYELRFTIAAAGPDQVDLGACSSGEFPGVFGAIYRGLVIGSRGHVLAVRRLLAGIADRAEGEARAHPVG